MPGQRKTLFLTIAGLILSIMMPAQNLPRLKADKAINKGTLGSGVVYYVVPNSSEKGFADFAVVRKDEVPSDETRKQARGIEGFMSRTGTGFRQDGLITDRDGSTVFRIDGVPVYDKSVLDSTLLYMFDFMSKSRSSQSVIISGDVDVADVKRKMDIFSMMVPRIYPGSGSDYVWEPSVAPVSVFRRTDDGDLSEITVTYSTARAPKEYMNTAQNLVMDIFAREFDVIVQRRLERMLPAAGIPYYRIETSHLGSDDSAGDEKYSVVVGTDKDHASDAMKAIATVLSSIGTYGPVPGEFADAKSILSADMKRLANASLTNGEYVEKCIASFLFDAPLSPFSEEENLFAGKMVSDTTDRGFFSGIAKALMDDPRNAFIEYAAPLDSLDESELLFEYNLACLLASTMPSSGEYLETRSDTASLAAKFPKVKIKSEKPDPVSGGKMYFFSNGIKVVFKRIGGGGMFNYALHNAGGLSSVPDLKEGEGGFIPDMLFLSEIAGMKGYNFRNMLSTNGIEMNTEVGVKDMIISGSAPVSRLPLLLKSLIAIANERKPDPSAFEYYRKGEELSLKYDSSRASGIYNSLYSSLFPGFKYSPARSSSALGKDTQEKAEIFFSKRFQQVNDGVIVIAGDINEDVLKKLLCKTLGGFRTLNTLERKPSVQYRPATGVKSVDFDGRVKGLNILMSSDIPLTGENYYAAPMALAVLRKYLSRELVPLGMSYSLNGEYFSYPEERYNLHIAVYPLPEGSMPSSVTNATIPDALSAVKKALSDAATKSVSKADLAAYKNLVTARTAAATGAPKTVVDAVVARYCMGKDFVTKYKDTIGAVDSGRITNILKSLQGGPRVEMIVE